MVYVLILKLNRKKTADVKIGIILFDDQLFFTLYLNSNNIPSRNGCLIIIPS